MKQIVVILAPGFEEIEALTAVDYIRRAGLSVTTVGVGGLRIEGAHGIVVEADKVVADWVGLPDAVVVPGGMPGAANIAANDDAKRIIRSVAERGGLVAAICAAPAVVLGPLGLLDGKRFTCFPGREKDVPKGRFSTDRVVKDGNILTSRSAGTSGEFSLAIVRHLAGDVVAKELAERTLQR